MHFFLALGGTLIGSSVRFRILGRTICGAVLREIRAAAGGPVQDLAHE